MNFDHKCLMVLKAAEPLYTWLHSVIELVEQSLAKDFKHLADDKISITLEQMQSDANCYIIPMLQPDQASKFLEEHVKALFEIELTTWCSLQLLWPTINYENLVTAFNFEFYFDFMSFEAEEVDDAQKSLPHLTLLLKPNEHFRQFLQTQLLERRKLSTESLNKYLDMQAVQEGSTTVLTNVSDLTELDYFLDQHAAEMIEHQLLFWGGEPLRDSWTAGYDLKALNNFFYIEVHQHVYLMLH